MHARQRATRTARMPTAIRFELRAFEGSDAAPQCPGRSGARDPRHPGYNC